jgi:hypothetical protein
VKEQSFRERERKKRGKERKGKKNICSYCGRRQKKDRIMKEI